MELLEKPNFMSKTPCSCWCNCTNGRAPLRYVSGLSNPRKPICRLCWINHAGKENEILAETIEAENKYIKIVLKSGTKNSKTKNKTKIWEVINKSQNYALGSINWYYAWREYVISVYDEDTIFNHECLTFISEFIQNEMEKRKNGKRKNKYSDKHSQ